MNMHNYKPVGLLLTLNILVILSLSGVLSDANYNEKVSRVNFLYPAIKLVHDIEVNPGPGQRTRNKSNKVKIAHLNVRSLKHREHFIQVKDTVISNDFDVFTISETWLDNSVSNLEVEIPGYNVFRVDRQNKRGGGVCSYAKQSFKTQVLNEISGISNGGLHQLWMEIKVRSFKSFVVCTTYRPPGSPIACLDNDLGPSLISALLLNKPIYILGDINCNLLQSDLPDSQALISFCSTYNLNQIVTQPTRITHSTESLIDVILVSNAKHVLDTKVLSSSISDHDLVYAELGLKKPRTQATFVTTRTLKEYSPDKFLNDIALAPWSVLDVFDDPDDKLYAFNSMFNDILEEHALVKTIRMRGRPNPYITDEIRNLMATRDNWKRNFRQTKDPFAWSAYKNFSREVKREIRMAEKEFVAQQIKENKNNTNSMWKAIRGCIPKKSASQKTYSKDNEIVANEINIFFANVGTNTIEKVNALGRAIQG
uniref:Uncharacterized protein LOC116303067 n=1 Tax=Actinia tenebrosa TaxID=6105 RepID=A0A6P8INI3_ACTTE